MDFSWQYSRSINNFNYPSFDGYISRVATNARLDRGSTYRLCLNLNRNNSPEGIEVPVCILASGTIALLSDVDKLVVPILINTTPIVCNGAETILKRFSITSFNDGIIQITTPKGECYYGGSGIILDKDYTPLVMTTFKGSFERNSIVYKESIVHIHPKVFMDDVSILNKSIARKMIPFLLGHTPAIPCYNPSTTIVLSDTLKRSKYHISIDDMSGWINSPIKPKDPINIKQDLNQFLRDNIGEVLTQFRDDCR